jgi:Uncharacterized protein conserved in bacteria
MRAEVKSYMHTNDIKDFQKEIDSLKAENQYLKKLLDENNIPYHLNDNIEDKELFDPNQGARIIHKDIMPEDANTFFGMFWGRTDVFAKRTVKKATGEVNYYTQCYNFWKPGCPRISGSKIKCQECKKQAYRKLEKRDILKHLQGDSENGEDVIAIYPLLKEDICRFIVFDFDNHKKGAQKRDYANDDNIWREEVDSLRKICEINGIDALVERSRSGKGAHLWIFFQKPIAASLARKFGNALLRKGAESVNLKSFRYYDRMLPMQDHAPESGVGNLIALPLQGQALKEGNSAFVDRNWNAYPEQWEVLLSKQKFDEEFIEEKIKEWKVPDFKGIVRLEKPFDNKEEKPWEKSRHFLVDDVEGKLHIVLSDGIYIDTSNLKARIQNQIRELAAFRNPIFYKNQAMGLSNFMNASFIYLGSDENEYIKIPRGLLEVLLGKCKEVCIECQVEDKRQVGREISVEFTAKLKEPQIPAVEKMVQSDIGILSAATAFGKTVVCCAMIAKKKTNALILLQSAALMKQWEEALGKFLTIDEELPEYETPSGRKKKRKNVIGKLRGAHDSTTGIIDIAMVGSLCKQGKYHKRLSEYGLVLLDECHHAASDTIVGVLQQVNAKYVYGVTATPFRGDGLERINSMLLGPIRYKYSSKERAKEQNILHLVYPRFTRAVIPKFKQDKLHPNEAYSIIRENEDRDDLIVSDVVKCVAKGRTPVVLSRYLDHAKRLYERLRKDADYVFLLSGQNKAKMNNEILDSMNQVERDKKMILVATGKLIGEGFDFPRLDTLIMATPVAWKGIVEQYAGRLNRDYKGKESVIIYDYVDSHISMFDKMYYKRLKAYKQIGYEVYSGNHLEKSERNAIFDVDTYKEVYEQDLLEANEEIILSSPAISGKKVEQIMTLLKEKQELGIRIIIVTWKPDCYGYGDSGYWMELQERMRKFGFEMNLVEDYCEHYCIVDKEIVWYGSVNFLGKEDAEDNLMRVCSRSIATELMELTFGRGQCERESM